MDHALRIETDDHDGAVTVVRCAGEIDISTCEDLRAALNAALAKARAIRIDLMAVSFMDSTGLACLWEMQERCNHADVPLEMTVPADGIVRRLFMITSAHRLFKLTEIGDVAEPADESAPL